MTALFPFDVDALTDGGDVSDNAEGTGPGAWHGAEMCCLECGETRRLECSALFSQPGFQVGLVCGECGVVFGKYRL